MKPREDELPARLSDGEGQTAELLQRFTRQPPQAPGENAAWDGTLARLGRDAGAHRSRLILALVFGAVTGAAALYVALFPHPRFFAASSTPPAALAAAPSPASTAPTLSPLPGPAGSASAVPTRIPPRAPTNPTDAPAVDAPHIRLGRAAVGLPVGVAELVDEASVTLSRDGIARAFTTTTAATVELTTGALDLRVEKRRAEAGHAFEVQAGRYHFTVLGTVFRVSRTASDVTLSVTEGRVAVSQGPTTLAVVTAGGFWSGGGKIDSLPSPRQAPSTATNPAPASARLAARTTSGTAAPTSFGPASSASLPAEGVCAARAAAGDATGAIDCFTAAATGAGLGAEVSLYQAARLYRDALGQPERAVATLQEAHRRFPAGALSTEVDLSLAELLPKLGRYREALAATRAVLDRHPAEPRAAELHLLRGDLLRAGLASCGAAESEYAAAADAGDERVADPASFWRATCLETDGRRPEARAAFALYLTRPHPSHVAEARRHLQTLESGAH